MYEVGSVVKTAAPVGCYRDDAARTMTMFSSPYHAFDVCRADALAGNYRYFALQDGKADGTAACFVSNGLAKVQVLGPSTECNRPPDSNGRNLGGAWANYVYELK